MTRHEPLEGLMMERLDLQNMEHPTFNTNID